jgi:hypothetical protein
MLNHLPPVFSDNSVDEQIKNKLPNEYYSICQKRIRRYTESYKNWMNDFPTRPLVDKSSLEREILIYENKENKTNYDIDHLNKIKDSLAQGLYCEGDNIHAQYKANWADRKLAFVWPDANESTLRQQEESELLALFSQS